MTPMMTGGGNPLGKFRGHPFLLETSIAARKSTRHSERLPPLWCATWLQRGWRHPAGHGGGPPSGLGVQGDDNSPLARSL